MSGVNFTNAPKGTYLTTHKIITYTAYKTRKTRKTLFVESVTVTIWVNKSASLSLISPNMMEYSFRTQAC